MKEKVFYPNTLTKLSSSLSIRKYKTFSLKSFRTAKLLGEVQLLAGSEAFRLVILMNDS